MITAFLITILTPLFTTLDDQTLRADVTLTTQDDQSGPITYWGALIMHGNCFMVDMSSIEASYDGSTMYVYSSDTEELTLTAPTDDELRQTNPLLFAKALVPVCRVTEQPYSGGVSTLVTLTPKDKTAPISRFTIRVGTSSLLPEQIEIHETSGRQTTIKLKNARYDRTHPSFSMVKPNAYINDLR